MPIPDQSLLYVRGFDAATQRYRYEVNQRFGATNPAFTPFRAPVTLTAMMRFDLGPTRERQVLSQQLDRGRRADGDRVPEPLLRAMLTSGGGLPNPLATVLRQQDSLALTSAQADSTATMNRAYLVRLDSIWSPVAKYLAELPKDYDQGAAYDRYLAARRATVDLLSSIAPRVRSLLTAEQMRKLPPFITGYLDTRYLASIRSGTTMFAGAPMLPGGAMMPGGMSVDVGGGNVRTIMIRH
jgi:hypothetical protein